MMGKRHSLVEEMGRRRVSAILRTNDTRTAHEAMEAAVRGGFTMVEFTLTVPGVFELIREFSAREGLLVGAGTVLTSGEAERAVSAGASFLVSPVVDPRVLEAAAMLDVPSVPGTSTPTEMMTAHRAGADLLKIFPAPADVAAFVAQVRGPFPEWRLFPTAGVTPENFQAVLGAGAFGVGFVASLFRHQDLAAGDFEAVERRAAGIFQALKN